MGAAAGDEAAPAAFEAGPGERPRDPGMDGFDPLA